MKKVLATILAVASFATVFAGCSANSSSNKFIVGFDSEFPPMGFVDDNGNYVGFDLDLAQETAKRLNMEYVAQPIAWDSKDQELQSGNISCIWNGFTMSSERIEKYTWTTAYMANKQVVVVKNGADIASLADLSGKKVAVQKDSSGLAALEGNSELTSTFAELIQVDSYLNAMMELETGSVDAIVMDEIVARYQITTSGKDFKVLDEAISTEEYGVGFLHGNTELRDKVQKALEEMAADGTLATISNKWFGEDITTIR